MSVLEVFRAAALLAMLSSAVLSMPVHSHHSFAMYDRTNVRVITGVVTRVHPDANHLQIFVVPMNEDRDGVIRRDDGEPEVWAIEMDRASVSAQHGITVNAFPPGTIFSVGFHPLRTGEHAGGRTGGLFRCPGDTPPPPGEHCDAVEGSTSHGEARGSSQLPEPTESP